MNKSKLLKTSILLLIILSVNTAKATSMLDLISGASITVNDKIFTNWSFKQTASDSTFLLDAANIDVTGLPATGSNILDPGPGLAFNILNGASVTGNGSYSFLDFTIDFLASILPGSGNQFADVSLGLGGTSLAGTEDLGVFIQEDIHNAANQLIATTDVGNDILGGVESSNLNNSYLFLPADYAQSINVTKNILIWSAALGETASLTGFDQHFSQVPEPGILLLLSMGLIGASIAKKKTTIKL